MFLLDTNAVSEPRRASPDPGLLAWLNAQPDAALFLSSITVGELRRGVLRLEDGHRRRSLEAWLGSLVASFADRIIPVGLVEIERWADLAEAGRAEGRVSGLMDELIAASALAHGFTVVTRNVRHFDRTGCRVLSPWSA